jgi:hypothetical protein
MNVKSQAICLQFIIHRSAFIIFRVAHLSLLTAQTKVYKHFMFGKDTQLWIG